MIEAGDDVFSALLVFGRAFDEVLVGRFRQNLCDYLSSVSAPRFFEQKGVFVANIQMGHDTRRLLDDLCAQCDAARLVDVDTLIVRGPIDPGPDPLYRLVADYVGTEPRTISSLLHALPLEPTRARVLVGQLLANHALDAAAAPEEVVPDADTAVESEELTVALPPIPPPPKWSPPDTPAPDEVPALVAAPPPARPIQLVEALTPIPPTFDDDDTLSSEVTRALDDAAPAAASTGSAERPRKTKRTRTTPGPSRSTDGPGRRCCGRVPPPEVRTARRTPGARSRLRSDPVARVAAAPAVPDVHPAPGPLAGRLGERSRPGQRAGERARSDEAAAAAGATPGPCEPTSRFRRAGR